MPDKMHLKWLFYSQTDLNAGKNLLTFGERYTGVAAYHAQQSMEKCLKAYHLFNNLEILKTHDLNLLLSKCIIFNTEFFRFKNHAKQLNPFSMITRYPDDQCADLNIQETENLLKLALECYNFVDQQFKK